jgi:hypothetical protein
MKRLKKTDPKEPYTNFSHHTKKCNKKTPHKKGDKKII